MAIARIQLIISGKVQGVAYRFSAKREADQLSLTGWVQNRANGDVEIMAEGHQTQLNQFIKWAQTGPKFADVHGIVIKNLKASNEFKQFNIR